MKKKVTKRGRKKLLSKLPSNLAFWKLTIQNEEELKQFLLRGSERQKHCIIRVLNYLKNLEPLEFGLFNGDTWLKKFKESIKET